MLTGYLGIGFLAGFSLWIGKFILLWMFLGCFPKGLSKWIYRTPIVIIALDFIIGGLAAPIAGMAGGTIAMLTMITFGTLSALFVLYKIVLLRIKQKFKNFRFSLPNHNTEWSRHSYR